MCVDMRQTVFSLEAGKVATDSIGSHMSATFSRKDIGRFLPAVAHCKACFQLPAAIFPEKVHGFLRELYNPFCPGFGGGFINAPVRGVKQGGVNADGGFPPVHTIPFQSHDLTPTATGDHQQVNQHLPFDWLFRGGVPNCNQFRGLEGSNLCFFFLRRCCLVSCVIRHQHFFFRLSKHYMDKAVIGQHRGWRKLDWIWADSPVQHISAHGLVSVPVTTRAQEEENMVRRRKEIRHSKRF